MGRLNPSRETKCSGTYGDLENIHFPCSADHEQNWQPYPVDPYSAYNICDDHTYVPTSPRDTPSIHPVVRDPKHGEREDPKRRIVRDSSHGEASRNRERPCEVPREMQP